MSAAFRQINLADFTVSGRNSSWEFEAYEIGLNNNFFVNWLSNSGLLAYLDAIGLAAGVVDSAITAVETLPASGNRTLLQAESGKTLLLTTATANNVITLPAVAAGLKFTIRHIATGNNVNTWTITSPVAGIIQGNHYNGAAAGATILNRTNLIASATAANVNVGDYLTLFCTGGSWHAIIYSRVAAAYTFT